MLEGLLAGKIVEFLSDYCEITQDQVKLSVFSGKGSLDHLVLKPDAFAKMFDLPVTVSRAVIRHVEFEIPWTSLKSSPCVVKISEILACVTPPTVDLTEKQKTELLARMKQRILSAFEERRREAGRTAAQIAAAEAEQQSGSYASRLFEIMLNNLIVEISNVHLRYECKHSEASGIPHTVLGLTLSGVKLQTTDDKGMPTFVDTQTQTVVYKHWALDGFRMYAEETPVEPLVSHIESTKQEAYWDMRMREQLSGSSSKSASAPAHVVDSTIFGPLSCSADGALVLKKAITQHPTRPYVNVSLRVGSLQAALNRAQYLAVMRMVVELTEAVDRLPKTAEQPQREDLWAEYEALFMREILGDEAPPVTTASPSTSPSTSPTTSPTTTSSSSPDTSNKQGAAAAASASPPTTPALSSAEAVRKRLEKLAELINAESLVKCRRRVYSRAASLLAQRTKELSDRAAKAIAAHEQEKKTLRAEAAEKGFFSSMFVKFSTSKDAINKETEQKQTALRALQEQLGISTKVSGSSAGGGDSSASSSDDDSDFVPDLSDLPATYEWLHLQVKVASLGITLKLNDKMSNIMFASGINIKHHHLKNDFVAPCVAEMNNWNVVLVKYNRQGSMLFDVSSRSLRVTNPTKSRDVLPDLVTAALDLHKRKKQKAAGGGVTVVTLGSDEASRAIAADLLSVKGRVRPLQQPIAGTTLDLDLSVVLRPLQIVLDPAMLRDFSNFFKVPSRRSIIHDTIGAAKKAAINAVEHASAQVFDALAHLKTLRLTLDATAPTWYLPQAVSELSDASPMLCVSLGRFVLSSTPPSDAEKAQRLKDITAAVSFGTAQDLPSSTVFDKYHASLQDVCVAYTSYSERDTFETLYKDQEAARRSDSVFFFVPPIVLSCDIFVRLTTTLAEHVPPYSVSASSNGLCLRASRHRFHLLQTQLLNTWFLESKRKKLRAKQSELSGDAVFFTSTSEQQQQQQQHAASIFLTGGEEDSALAGGSGAGAVSPTTPASAAAAAFEGSRMNSTTMLSGDGSNNSSSDVTSIDYFPSRSDSGVASATTLTVLPPVQRRTRPTTEYKIAVQSLSLELHEDEDSHDDDIETHHKENNGKDDDGKAQVARSLEKRWNPEPRFVFEFAPITAVSTTSTLSATYTAFLELPPSIANNLQQQHQRQPSEAERNSAISAAYSSFQRHDPVAHHLLSKRLFEQHHCTRLAVPQIAMVDRILRTRIITETAVEVAVDTVSLVDEGGDALVVQTVLAAPLALKPAVSSVYDKQQLLVQERRHFSAKQLHLARVVQRYREHLPPVHVTIEFKKPADFVVGTSLMDVVDLVWDLKQINNAAAAARLAAIASGSPTTVALVSGGGGGASASARATAAAKGSLTTTTTTTTPAAAAAADGLDSSASLVSLDSNFYLVKSSANVISSSSSSSLPSTPTKRRPGAISAAGTTTSSGLSSISSPLLNLLCETRVEIRIPRLGAQLNDRPAIVPISEPDFLRHPRRAQRLAEKDRHFATAFLEALTVRVEFLRQERSLLLWEQREQLRQRNLMIQRHAVIPRRASSNTFTADTNKLATVTTTTTTTTSSATCTPLRQREDQEEVEKKKRREEEEDEEKSLFELEKELLLSERDFQPLRSTSVKLTATDLVLQLEEQSMNPTMEPYFDVYSRAPRHRLISSLASTKDENEEEGAGASGATTSDRNSNNNKNKAKPVFITFDYATTPALPLLHTERLEQQSRDRKLRDKKKFERFGATLEANVGQALVVHDSTTLVYMLDYGTSGFLNRLGVVAERSVYDGSGGVSSPLLPRKRAAAATTPSTTPTRVVLDDDEVFQLTQGASPAGKAAAMPEGAEDEAQADDGDVTGILVQFAKPSVILPWTDAATGRTKHFTASAETLRVSTAICNRGAVSCFTHGDAKRAALGRGYNSAAVFTALSIDLHGWSMAVAPAAAAGEKQHLLMPPSQLTVCFRSCISNPTIAEMVLRQQQQQEENAAGDDDHVEDSRNDAYFQDEFFVPTTHVYSSQLALNVVAGPMLEEVISALVLNVLRTPPTIDALVHQHKKLDEMRQQKQQQLRNILVITSSSNDNATGLAHHSVPPADPATLAAAATAAAASRPVFTPKKPDRATEIVFGLLHFTAFSKPTTTRTSGSDPIFDLRCADFCATLPSNGLVLDAERSRRMDPPQQTLTVTSIHVRDIRRPKSSSSQQQQQQHQRGDLQQDLFVARATHLCISSRKMMNQSQQQQQQQQQHTHQHVRLHVNVERFAASDQWLCVYDTLVSPQNMKALDPLFERSDDEENEANRSDSRFKNTTTTTTATPTKSLSFELVASHFVIPCLSPERICVFSVNLHRLHLYYARDSAEQFAVRLHFGALTMTDSLRQVEIITSQQHQECQQEEKQQRKKKKTTVTTTMGDNQQSDDSGDDNDSQDSKNNHLGIHWYWRAAAQSQKHLLDIVAPSNQARQQQHQQHNHQLGSLANEVVDEDAWLVLRVRSGKPTMDVGVDMRNLSMFFFVPSVLSLADWAVTPDGTVDTLMKIGGDTTDLLAKKEAARKQQAQRQQHQQQNHHLPDSSSDSNNKSASVIKTRVKLCWQTPLIFVPDSVESLRYVSRKHRAAQFHQHLQRQQQQQQQQHELKKYRDPNLLASASPSLSSSPWFNLLDGVTERALLCNLGFVDVAVQLLDADEKVAVQATMSNGQIPGFFANCDVVVDYSQTVDVMKVGVELGETASLSLSASSLSLLSRCLMSNLLLDELWYPLEVSSSSSSSPGSVSPGGIGDLDDEIVDVAAVEQQKQEQTQQRAIVQSVIQHHHQHHRHLATFLLTDSTKDDQKKNNPKVKDITVTLRKISVLCLREEKVGMRSAAAAASTSSSSPSFSSSSLVARFEIQAASIHTHDVDGIQLSIGQMLLLREATKAGSSPAHSQSVVMFRCGGGEQQQYRDAIRYSSRPHTSSSSGEHRCIRISDSQLDLVAGTIAELVALFRSFQLSSDAEEIIEERLLEVSNNNNNNLDADDVHQPSTAVAAAARSIPPSSAVSAPPRCCVQNTIELHMRSTTLFLFNSATGERMLGFAWEKADVEYIEEKTSSASADPTTTTTTTKDFKLRCGHMHLTDYSSPGTLYSELLQTDVAHDGDHTNNNDNNNNRPDVAEEHHHLPNHCRQQTAVQPGAGGDAADNSLLRSVSSSSNDASTGGDFISLDVHLGDNNNDDDGKLRIVNSVTLRTSRTSLVVAPNAILAAVKEVEALIGAVSTVKSTTTTRATATTASKTGDQQQQRSRENSDVVFESANDETGERERQQQQQQAAAPLDPIRMLMQTKFDLVTDQLSVTFIRHRTSDECIVVTPGSLTVRSELQFGGGERGERDELRQHAIAARAVGTNMRILGSRALAVSDNVIEAVWTLRPAQQQQKSAAAAAESTSSSSSSLAVTDHIHADVKGISLTFSHEQFRFVLALLGDHWSWMQRRREEILMEELRKKQMMDEAADGGGGSGAEKLVRAAELNSGSSSRISVSVAGVKLSLEGTVEAKVERFTAATSSNRSADSLTMSWDVCQVTHEATRLIECTDLFVEQTKTHPHPRGGESDSRSNNINNNNISANEEEELCVTASDARVFVSSRALSCIVRDILIPVEDCLLKRRRPEPRLLLRDTPEAKLDADTVLTPSHYLHASSSSGFVYFTLDLGGHTLTITPECFTKMQRLVAEASRAGGIGIGEQRHTNNSNNSRHSASDKNGGAAAASSNDEGGEGQEHQPLLPDYGTPVAETILVIDAHCVLVLTNGVLAIPEYFTMHSWTALGFSSRLIVHSSVAIRYNEWPLTPLSVLRASGQHLTQQQQQQQQSRKRVISPVPRTGSRRTAGAGTAAAASANSGGSSIRSGVVLPKTTMEQLKREHPLPHITSLSRRLSIHLRCCVSVTDYQGRFLQGVSTKLAFEDIRVSTLSAATLATATSASSSSAYHPNNQNQNLSNNNNNKKGERTTKHTLEIGVSTLQSFEPDNESQSCLVMLPMSLRVLMTGSLEQRSVVVQPRQEQPQVLQEFGDALSFGVRVGMIKDFAAELEELAAIFDVVEQSSDFVDKAALSRDTLHRQRQSSELFGDTAESQTSQQQEQQQQQAQSNNNGNNQHMMMFQRPQQHRHERPKPPQLMTQQKLQLLEIAINDAAGEWTEVHEAARNVFSLAQKIGAFENASTTIDFQARHIDCLFIGPSDSSFGEARVRNCCIRYHYPVTKLELALQATFFVFNTDAGTWEPALEECSAKFTWDTTRANNTVSMLIPNVALNVSPTIVLQLRRIFDLLGNSKSSTASALRRKLQREQERKKALLAQQSQQHQQRTSGEHHHRHSSSNTQQQQQQQNPHLRRISSATGISDHSVEEQTSDLDLTTTAKPRNNNSEHHLPLTVRNFTRQPLLIGDVSVAAGFPLRQTSSSDFAGPATTSAASSYADQHRLLLPAATILARSTGEMMVTLIGEDDRATRGASGAASLTSGVRSVTFNAQRSATVWLGPYLCRYEPAEVSVVDSGRAPQRTLTIFSAHSSSNPTGAAAAAAAASASSSLPSASSQRARVADMVAPLSTSLAVVSIRSYLCDVDIRIQGIGDIQPGECFYLHSGINLETHLVIEPVRHHTDPMARYKPGDAGTAVYPLSIRQVLDGINCRLNCWQLPDPRLPPAQQAQQRVRGVFLRLESVNRGMVLGLPHYEIKIRGCFTIQNLLPHPMTTLWTQSRNNAAIAGAAAAVVSASANSSSAPMQQMQREADTMMFSFQLPPLSTREVTLLASPLNAALQLIVASGDDDTVYSLAEMLLHGGDARFILRTAEGLQALKQHQLNLQQQQHLRRTSGGSSNVNVNAAAYSKPNQSEFALQVSVRSGIVKFFVPFVLVNHAPLPLQFYGAFDPDPTTRNWHSVPPHTHHGVCVNPAPGTTVISDPRSKTTAERNQAAMEGGGGGTELCVNIGFFDFRTHQPVPLHVVGTTGLLHLVNRDSPDIIFLTFRTTFSASAPGRETRTIIVSPRWAFVNRCPFPIKIGQDLQGRGYRPDEKWSPRNVMKLNPDSATQSYLWSVPNNLEEVGFRAVVTAAPTSSSSSSSSSSASRVWEMQGNPPSAIKIDSVGTWQICIADPDGNAYGSNTSSRPSASSNPASPVTPYQQQQASSSAGIIIAEAEVIEEDHYVFVIIRLPLVHPVVLSNHTAVPLSVVDPRLNRSRVDVPAYARRGVITLPPFESSAAAAEASTTAKQKAKQIVVPTHQQRNRMLQEGWMVQIEVLGTIAAFDLFDADNAEPTVLSDTGVRICFARGRHGQRLLVVEPVPRSALLLADQQQQQRLQQQQQQQQQRKSAAAIPVGGRFAVPSPLPLPSNNGGNSRFGTATNAGGTQQQQRQQQQQPQQHLIIATVPVAGVTLVAEVRSVSVSVCHRAKELLLLTVNGNKLSMNRAAGVETTSFVISSYQVDNMGEAHPPFPVCVFTLRERSQFAVSVNVKRKLTSAEHFIYLRSVTINVMPNVVQVGDALLLSVLSVFDALSHAASTPLAAATTLANMSSSSSSATNAGTNNNNSNKSSGGATASGGGASAAAASTTVSAPTNSDQLRVAGSGVGCYAPPIPSDDDLFFLAPVRSDVRDTMVVIDELAVNPITLRVWLVRQRSHDIFEAAGQGSLLSLLTIDMKDVAVVADGVMLRNLQDTLGQQLIVLNNLYVNKLKTQLTGLFLAYVGSIPFLGAPVRFLHTLGKGFTRFFMEPIENIDNEGERAVAFVRGTAAAVGGVVGGTFGILADVTGSGANLAKKAAGEEDDYRAQRSMVPGTARGLWKGLTGLVMKPAEGFQDDGFIGLAIGVGQGLVGVVASPVAGVLSDVSRVSGAVAEAVTDRSLPSVSRVRRARIFTDTGGLVQLKFAAEIFEHQRSHNTGSGVIWSNSLLPSEGEAFCDARGDGLSKQRVEAQHQTELQILRRTRIIRQHLMLEQQQQQNRFSSQQLQQQQQQQQQRVAVVAGGGDSAGAGADGGGDQWRIDRVGTNFSGWMYASVLKDWTFLWTTACASRPLRRRRWVLLLHDFQPSRIAEKVMGTAFDASHAHARASGAAALDIDFAFAAMHRARDRSAASSSSALSISSQQQQRTGSSAALTGAILRAVFPQRAGTLAWVVEVVENERYYPVAGWTQQMMPSDPPSCSTRSGVPLQSMRAQLDALVPPGWVWYGTWIQYPAEYASNFDKEFTVEHSALKVVKRTVYRRILIWKG